MKNTYKVKGMTCAICKNTIEKKLNNITGINKCSVNLLENEMNIIYDEDIISIEEIAANVDELGYKLVLNEKITVDYTKIKYLISIILMIILMYVSMGHMFNLPNITNNHLYNGLLQFVLATIIYILNSQYLTNGLKSLIHFNPNMDSLVALSTSISYLYSLYALYKISNNIHEFHLYFETGAMILVIISIGKYIEGINKVKTTKAIKLLSELRPIEAIILENGFERSINIDDLKIGDIIISKAGEIIAQDAIIIEGSANINESMITGESMPIFKQVDDEVIGGTINTNGLLKLKVIKTSNDSTINRIIELVREATSKKIPIERFADKVSSFFVPIIIIISFITFITWYLIYNDFELAMNFAMSVLVISCPCALGLATPSAIMVANGVSAKNGILIKNTAVLEIGHKLKTIIFDKTGTITENKVQIIKEISYDHSFVDTLYNLEKRSNHPIAKAILNKYKSSSEIKFSLYKELSGYGIIAEDDKHRYLAGNKKLMDKYNIIYDNNIINEADNKHHSYIIIAKDNIVLGLVLVADIIKNTSKKAIQGLKKDKIYTIMCTGDNRIIANNIASLIEIDEVIAEVKPEDKYNIVNKYKKHGLVGMVGDGINDAIALSVADISFAISSGSDIAFESSDIILMKNDLTDISLFMKIASKTMTIIKENLFWALFYNIIFIPLAAGVFYNSLGLKLNPMVGAFSMSISSIIVLTNALRIRNIKKEKEMKSIIKIKGMMCMNCVKHVNKALNNLGYEAEVSLENHNAIINAKVDKELIKKALEDAGYELIEIIYES